MLSYNLGIVPSNLNPVFTHLFMRLLRVFRCLTSSASMSSFCRVRVKLAISMARSANGAESGKSKLWRWQKVRKREKDEARFRIRKDWGTCVHLKICLYPCMFICVCLHTYTCICQYVPAARSVLHWPFVSWSGRAIAMTDVCFDSHKANTAQTPVQNANYMPLNGSMNLHQHPYT